MIMGLVSPPLRPIANSIIDRIIKTKTKTKKFDDEVHDSDAHEVLDPLGNLLNYNLLFWSSDFDND
jgi:hypothetical protein